MPRSPRLATAAYALAAAVVVLDQLSKYWVLEVIQLPARGVVPVLPFFSLSMVWNDGVSFGLFQGSSVGRWILVFFSVAVAIALAFWARKADRRLVAAAIGLIMGGAVGNVIDRIRFGAVADFLDFSGLWFPWVFNVADSAITIGVVLLLLDGVLPKRKPAA